MKKKSKDALIFERPDFRTRKSIEGENMLKWTVLLGDLSIGNVYSPGV